MSGLCSEMDVDWDVEVTLAEMETSLVTARHQRHPANPLNGDPTLVSTYSSLYWWTSTTSLDSDLGNLEHNSGTFKSPLFLPIAVFTLPQNLSSMFLQTSELISKFDLPRDRFQQAVFFLDTHKL